MSFVPLYVTYRFFLLWFSIFFFALYSVLAMICCHWVFPFLVLSSWGYLCFLYLHGYLFISLEKFSSVILLMILSVPLTWGTSSSSMPIMERFGLLMVFHIPCMFLFHGLKRFHLDSLLCLLNPAILSSARFILLLRLCPEFSSWDVGLFNSISISDCVFFNIYIALFN